MQLNNRKINYKKQAREKRFSDESWNETESQWGREQAREKPSVSEAEAVMRTLGINGSETESPQHLAAGAESDNRSRKQPAANRPETLTGREKKKKNQIHIKIRA